LPSSDPEEHRVEELPLDGSVLEADDQTESEEFDGHQVNLHL
jgi:hypothetical protein